MGGRYLASPGLDTRQKEQLIKATIYTISSHTHTNYSLSNCTTVQCGIMIIIFDTILILGRNGILNTK